MTTRAYLLIPNTTSIGGSNVVTGTIQSGSGSTLVLGAADDLSSVLPQTGGEFGSIRTDWLYLTNGTYSGYHWRIISCNNTTKNVIIDGTIPASIGTPTYAIKSAVDARCAWTTVTTVTYFECVAQDNQEAPKNDLNITRAANRTSVVVNMKKYSGTEVFSNYRIGPSSELCPGSTTKYTVEQIKRFWEYAGLYWPSITPKYCILYWYNHPAGNENTENYKYYSGSFGQQRVVPNLPQFSKDIYDITTLKQLAMEML